MTQSLVLQTLTDTTTLGRLIGELLRPGDLVILSGSLGAGKTALTKGIAAGMGVAGVITSPTFVIARKHQAHRPGGVGLVHVDAYRLGGSAELDDLDLDTDLSLMAVVVEWGEGIAEELADDRLLVELTRLADDSREASLTAFGPTWQERLPALTHSAGTSVESSDPGGSGAGSDEAWLNGAGLSATSVESSDPGGSGAGSDEAWLNGAGLSATSVESSDPGGSGES